MSFSDDSELIKAKLNSHLKKKLKDQDQSTQYSSKRKADNAPPEDSHLTPTSPKKPKTKAKKTNPKKAVELDDDGSNSGAEASDTATDGAGSQKVSTLDVLQVLLNQKKVSLLRDESVIEFIRKKQSRLS